MTVETPSIDERKFLVIATTALNMVNSAISDKREHLTVEELSDRSGVPLPTLKTLLREKVVEKPGCELTGEQWERLLSTVGIYPEDLIEQAKAKSRSAGVEWKYLASVDGVTQPSPEMNKRIQAILGVMGEFFLFATRKYLQVESGHHQPHVHV
ncbi:MAG: hypothetical protein NT105_19535 [Verrucomicrobia bacterium]|nr:hypothetical protein [Verrucomicrobiota bacterium]